MSAIVAHAMMAAVPGVTAASSLLPGWTGPAVVVALGLGMLAAYVRRLLFTPVEEAVLVRDPRTGRLLPPPELCRSRGSLFRLPRYP